MLKKQDERLKYFQNNYLFYFNWFLINVYFEKIIMNFYLNTNFMFLFIISKPIKYLLLSIQLLNKHSNVESDSIKI